MTNDLMLISKSNPASAAVAGPKKSKLQQLLNRYDKTGDYSILDDYLVLVPKDELAEEFLDLLESMDFIPKTVTWWSHAGWRFRIFKNSPGFKAFEISAGVVCASLDPLGVWIANDLREPWLLEWLPRRSPEDLEPAVLPEVLSCLKAMSYLANRKSFEEFLKRGS